jgi:hypothetical protein
VLEAQLQGPGVCNCDPAQGRIPLTDPSVSGGGDLDKAVKAQLQKDDYCTPTAGGLPACNEFCVCLIPEHQPPEKDQCLNDPNYVSQTGWCYVDPLPEDQGGQGVGNPDIVQACLASGQQPRILRFEPQPGAIAYIACLGAVVSGEGAGGTPPPDGG